MREWAASAARRSPIIRSFLSIFLFAGGFHGRALSIWSPMSGRQFAPQRIGMSASNVKIQKASRLEP